MLTHGLYLVHPGISVEDRRVVVFLGFDSYQQTMNIIYTSCEWEGRAGRFCVLEIYSTAPKGLSLDPSQDCRFSQGRTLINA